MITVTQIQQEAVAAELQKRRASKSYADRGISLGPGDGCEPSHPQPDGFDRGYLEEGHADPSPMADGPRTSPMPLMQHRVLPDAPYASAIPPEVIRSFTMGSPSERGR